MGTKLSGRKVILKAKNLIKKYGWIQGELGDRQTGFCLVGAVYEAATSRKTGNRNYAAIDRAIEKLRKAGVVGCIGGFNDASNMTRDRVQRILTKAAKL